MSTITMDEYLQRNPVDQEELARAVEEVRQYVRAYRLREIREAQSMTQVELARDLSVGQSQVSQIEHGHIGKSKVDTLRRYVEALGGELDVQARFGDTCYVLA
ncbi:MAG: helix-turn-helix transcriptional regulator [Propionibacteriaceae bacterium]|nr:helix-turn-helix transcriptional regulator [Propionibacteriaceae bacterium]